MRVLTEPYLCQMWNFIIFAKLVEVKFQLSVALIFISLITNDNQISVLSVSSTSFVILFSS